MWCTEIRRKSFIHLSDSPLLLQARYVPFWFDYPRFRWSTESILHTAYMISACCMMHMRAVRAWRLWLDVSWIKVVTGPRLGRQYIDMHSSLFLHLHHATILFDKDKDVLCSSSVCSLLVTVASCVFAYCVCMKLWGRKKTRVVNSLSSLLLQLQRWFSICAFVFSNTYEIFEYIYRSPVSMR